MRRFFAPEQNFSKDAVRLDADETRHLRDVLRKNVGDDVFVFDGVGREFRCRVGEIAKGFSELAILDETEPSSPESPFRITVAATILNGDKYDLIIQKAVELGVIKLIPVQTIRCDVKLRDAVKRLDRWRRIALEATKQCGRAKLMDVAEPAAFDEIIRACREDRAILFSERDGAGFETIAEGKEITAFFGPKGGWDDMELAATRDHGVNIVTLGGRILRAETASIAITAILQHRFGDLH